MTWSTIPDLSSRKRLLATALAMTIACAVVIIVVTLPAYQRSLGDTDDAVRLILVRELLQGHGWYHPEIARLQAPWGTLMHWSRLLDGGIAALELAFRLVLSPEHAEAAARFTWPLLWLFPASVSVLVIARRLGGSAAMLCCAVMAPMSLPAMEQFRLGRVDHHNVQVVMALIAVAAAIAGRDRWRAGAIAGLASAFGLAVGYEALLIHAGVGVFFALSLLLRPEAVRPARAYGLALALSAAGFFLIETPPRLWGVSVCDTIGANLVAALVIAGLGLAAASGLIRWKAAAFATLAASGLASAGAYAAMNPNCLHGPMGEVSPTIANYINHVLEMTSFWTFRSFNNTSAILYVSEPILALLVLLFLLERRNRWMDPSWMLLGLLLAGSFGLLMLHVRMQAYANWLAMPVLGCLVAELAGLWRRFLVPTVLAATALSPTSSAVAAMGVQAPFKNVHAKVKLAVDPTTPDACFYTASYKSLAALPAGLVLNDIDLGPFIVAQTPHLAMSGPYHRFRRGLDDTFRAFSMSPNQASAYVRSLNVNYVVDCPMHAHGYGRIVVGPHGLLAALDSGKPPDWLQPLSRPGEALQIYRVKPASSGAVPVRNVGAAR